MDRESLVCYEKGGRRVNFDNYTDEVNEWRRLVLQSRGIDAAQTLQYSGKIIAYGEQHNDAFSAWIWLLLQWRNVFYTQ